MILSSMKNKYVGFTQGLHTESLAIIDENGNCEFYPRGFDPSIVDTDNIAFFERPYLKKTRQLFAGQYKTAFAPLDLKLKPKKYFAHHLCHAANAFQQSDYMKARIIVADSIGEWDTVTIWNAHYDNYGYAHYKKEMWWSYPFSVGLFYSSITQLCGFKTNAEEGKLMELSKLGKVDNHLVDLMFDQFYDMNNHRGCSGMYPYYSKEDIAASAQYVIERFLRYYFRDGQLNCFAGGVAYNKLFIDKLRSAGYNIFVPENPGDPGSAIGAAALLYGRKICSTKTVVTTNH
jgi:carbamoyltransferase